MQQQKLGYPFSYGDELTPEMARKNRNKILGILLLLWFLKVPQIQSAPLPGAYGFTPIYILRGKVIRENALSTRLEQNLNNQNRPERTDISQYIPEFDCTIDNRQIQKKFKHATDFEVSGNYNPENAQLFKDRIIQHMKNPSTKILEGTFKTTEVTHYFDLKTGLNVMFNNETNKFISGWKLTDKQFKNIQDRGAL